MLHLATSLLVSSMTSSMVWQGMTSHRWNSGPPESVFETQAGPAHCICRAMECSAWFVCECGENGSLRHTYWSVKVSIKDRARRHLMNALKIHGPCLGMQLTSCCIVSNQERTETDKINAGKCLGQNMSDKTFEHGQKNRTLNDLLNK